MMSAEFARGLPDLRAGVYRHWKGRYYLVLGYAHDANADDLITGSMIDRWLEQEGSAAQPAIALKPMGERAVVVYMGLELDDAHKGPRLAVRTAQDFFRLVCSACGDPWECTLPHIGVPADPVPRFEYMGAAWYGWSVDPDAVSGTRPAPETVAAHTPTPTDTDAPQPWAPCPVGAPHEPHGPTKSVRCPGVPPRHTVSTTAPYGSPA